MLERKHPGITHAVAHVRGRIAAEEGVPFCLNPYRFWADLGEAWEEGHREHSSGQAVGSPSHSSCQ